ncbi:MAG: hypothetical protein VKJ64_20540 [Leptolyngbyaceae bacterium]|nr:hypothetical protein [Leptolyngbyaceae bacterium]
MLSYSAPANPSSVESMSYGDAPSAPLARDHAPSLQETDIHRELNQMEELLLDSPRIPLSRRTLVDEDRILEQLDAIRLALPDVIHDALNVVRQKEAILQEAEQYSQEIIASAERRAVQILDEMPLIRQAEMEAAQTRQQLQRECQALREEFLAEMEQLRRQTQQEADDLRQRAIAECHDIQQGADDYADQVLRDMEHRLTTMLTVIRNGRQQLQVQQAHEQSRRT